MVDAVVDVKGVQAVVKVDVFQVVKVPANMNVTQHALAVVKMGVIQVVMVVAKMVVISYVQVDARQAVKMDVQMHVEAAKAVVHMTVLPVILDVKEVA